MNQSKDRRRRAPNFGTGVPRAKWAGLACGTILVALVVCPIAASAQVDPGTAEAPSARQDEPQDGASQSQADDEAMFTFPRDPVAMVRAMGLPFVIPFVLASIVAVWISIERLVVLRQGRVIPRPFVDRFLHHLRQGTLNPDSALELCEENGSPVAQVFAHGIRKWGKPSVEVEQAIIDGGERQVSQLRRHLRILNGVATITPLIGLLGTVIGMIQAFLEIDATSAVAGADIEKLQLATGIALALLTTAAGLMIAIPSLIMYMYLAGRVDAVVMDMDLRAQNVVNLISAEGLANRPAPAPRATLPKPKAAMAEAKGKRAV